MAGKKCPSCRNEAPADAAFCSFCPYSFPEEESRADIEQVCQQQSWSPLPLMLGLGAAAVVAGLWMTIARSGANPKETREAPLKTTSAAPTAPAEPKYVQRLLAINNESSQDVSNAAPETVKAAPPPKEWKMRGVVYDLMTLAVLPQCRVVFRDDRVNALFETVTDETGRYRMILPPLEGRGYAISIHKKGYAASYLDPSVENVQRLPREKRAALAGELAGAVLSPSSLDPPGNEPLLTDFYLAPLK
jgi:hypothetical protein